MTNGKVFRINVKKGSFLLIQEKNLKGYIIKEEMHIGNKYLQNVHSN